MKQLAKTLAGACISRVLPQCRYESSLFLIGHMRCGSTALSAIVCSRSEISGYGEAHIAYTDRAALGILAQNQFWRKAWTPSATTLFDKILHSRYDSDACPEFFTARALFMARAPRPAIRSIRHLFAKLGTGEYATDVIAAEYYERRLEVMMRLWPRFAADRRIACTYESLTADPETVLATISTALGFDPPLVNRYAIKAAASARGAGDPLSASRYTQIVAAKDDLVAAPDLDIPVLRLAALEQAYQRFCELG